MDYKDKEIRYCKKWNSDSKYRLRSFVMQASIFSSCYSLFYILFFEVGFQLKLPEWPSIYKPIITGVFIGLLIAYFQFKGTKNKCKKMKDQGLI
jgi:hypothetical protein